jgi:hypothetical protein
MGLDAIANEVIGKLVGFLDTIAGFVVDLETQVAQHSEGAT